MKDEQANKLNEINIMEEKLNKKEQAMKMF